AAARPHMRFALAFLLVGLAARFLAFGFAEISFVFPFAFVLGGTRLFQRNGDGLTAALVLASLAAASAFEFAVLELVHNATGGFSLTGRCLRHSRFLNLMVLYCPKPT